MAMRFRLLLQSRSASVAAALRGSKASTSNEAQFERLDSGLLLVALPHNKSTVRIMVGFKAGSRYEDSVNSLGATHALRRAAGLSTRRYTENGLCRVISQMGSQLDAWSDREVLLYSLGIKRDHIHTGVRVLGQVSTQPELFPWELASLEEKLNLDLELLNRQDQNALLVELVHEAAFIPGALGGGLANSIYCKPHQFGSVLSTETLAQFRAARCIAPHATLIGHGVELDELRELADNHFNILVEKNEQKLEAANNKSVPRTRSTDIRVPSGHPNTQVAVVMPAFAYTHPLNTALAVAARLLGHGAARVAYGSNRQAGSLRSVISSEQSIQTSALHLAYSDAGLFGVHLSGSGKQLVEALKITRQELLKTATQGVTAGPQLEGAKKRLATDLLQLAESSEASMVQFAREGERGDLFTAAQRALDVTPEHVTEALRHVVKGRASMVAVGNLDGVPCLEEIQ